MPRANQSLFARQIILIVFYHIIKYYTQRESFASFFNIISKTIWRITFCTYIARPFSQLPLTKEYPILKTPLLNNVHTIIPADTMTL